MASHHYRRDGNVYRIPSRSDTTPWTNPSSYEPERVDPIEQLRLNASLRRSLFDRACDGLADFIADCVEKPGTALVLLSIGQMTVIVPAVLWAWLA